MLEVLICTVLYVHDADTPVMDCGDGPEHIRVANIDAPELNGDCPAERLAAEMGAFIASTAIDGATMTVEVLYRDRWGRRVANVGVHDVDEQTGRPTVWDYAEGSVQAGIAEWWRWTPDGSGSIDPRPDWCAVD